MSEDERFNTAQPADAGMREALEDIEALGRHLRQGGPDPMDLQELSDALSDAVDFASGALLVAASQPAIVACCVTGAIPGDGGACGDCDPCILGESFVPVPVKRLIAEKNSLLHRIGELEDKLDVALTAPGATTKSDGLCFCYFSCTDAPNCRRKAALESDVEALAATTAERPGTVTSEPEPSTSDPSSTRSEVTDGSNPK